MGILLPRSAQSPAGSLWVALRWIPRPDAPSFAGPGHSCSAYSGLIAQFMIYSLPSGARPPGQPCDRSGMREVTRSHPSLSWDVRKVDICGTLTFRFVPSNPQGIFRQPGRAENRLPWPAQYKVGRRRRRRKRSEAVEWNQNASDWESNLNSPRESWKLI